jgi:hypothetical protein
MLRVETEQKTCPKCGADRESLRDCLISPAPEDRSTAWIIIENCSACKAAVKEVIHV